MSEQQAARMARILYSLANRWERQDPIAAKHYRNMGRAIQAHDNDAFLKSRNKLDEHFAQMA